MAEDDRWHSHAVAVPQISNPRAATTGRRELCVRLRRTIFKLDAETEARTGLYLEGSVLRSGLCKLRGLRCIATEIGLNHCCPAWVELGSCQQSKNENADGA